MKGLKFVWLISEEDEDDCVDDGTAPDCNGGTIPDDCLRWEFCCPETEDDDGDEDEEEDEDGGGDNVEGGKCIIFFLSLLFLFFFLISFFFSFFLFWSNIDGFIVQMC